MPQFNFDHRNHQSESYSTNLVLVEVQLLLQLAHRGHLNSIRIGFGWSTRLRNLVGRRLVHDALLF